MSFFDHPFWMLLVFGFLVCPRVLLLSLWIPLRTGLGEVITYPWLSILGFFFAPRFTLACLLAGFYWSTNSVLCMVAFFLSFAGEGVEKAVFRRKLFHFKLGHWRFQWGRPN